MRQKKTKEGGERESFALSLCVARTKNILKISHKGQKRRRKKASFQGEENILSLFSLFKGRQGFLSPPSSSSSSSAVFVKYRAAREERKQRAARGRKNPDIWWREEVLLGVFLLIERSLCLRAFSPSNFPSEGIFIGLFFPTIFLLFGGKTALLKPSFSPLIFFFLSFRKEGNEEEKNQHKKSTARVRRASTTLYIILFFRRKEE